MSREGNDLREVAVYDILYIYMYVNMCIFGGFFYYIRGHYLGKGSCKLLCMSIYNAGNVEVYF